MLNKTFHDKQLVFKPENFQGEIRLVGENELKVPKEGFIAGSLFIYMNEKNVTQRKTPLKIGIYENGKKIKTITTSFLGPFGGGV